MCMFPFLKPARKFFHEASHIFDDPVYVSQRQLSPIKISLHFPESQITLVQSRCVKVVPNGVERITIIVIFHRRADGEMLVISFDIWLAKSIANWSPGA